MTQYQKTPVKTIEDAIAEQIPRDKDCNKCPLACKDTCSVTEEKLGSGETYCDLKDVNA